MNLTVKLPTGFTIKTKTKSTNSACNTSILSDYPPPTALTANLTPRREAANQTVEWPREATFSRPSCSCSLVASLHFFSSMFGTER